MSGVEYLPTSQMLGNNVVVGGRGEAISTYLAFYEITSYAVPVPSCTAFLLEELTYEDRAK